MRHVVDSIQGINSFGGLQSYNSEYDNAFYNAYYRYDVTITGGPWTDHLGNPASATYYPKLFDGSYDNFRTCLPAGNTGTINIVVNTKGETDPTGFTYPQGWIYVSFYNASTSNGHTVSGRYKDRNGVWFDMTNETQIGSSGQWRLNLSQNPYIVEYEITVDNSSGSSIVYLNQIEYHLFRSGTQPFSATTKRRWKERLTVYCMKTFLVKF